MLQVLQVPLEQLELVRLGFKDLPERTVQQGLQELQELRVLPVPTELLVLRESVLMVPQELLELVLMVPLVQQELV